MAIEIVVVETPELGDRSYLVHDGDVAAVIDPQRDIERVEAAARAAGVRIACVAETHIHNDYVSGGYALATALRVPYLVEAHEPVGFERVAVADGDVVEVGDAFALRVVATPGHTRRHLSYVALDAGTPLAVCTGGSLLFGTMGRTDLSGPAATPELTRRQFASAHRLAALPGNVRVLPTHGFGSFCSPGAAGHQTSSDIAEQTRDNLAFRAQGEQDFVERLLADLIDHPRYYAHMAARNLAGAEPVESAPPQPLDGPALLGAIDAGAWVVDLRERGAFAAGHLAGSVGVEYGASFTTYLGWVLPWHTPLVLVDDRAERIDRARLALTRIGVDTLAGSHAGGLPHLAGGPAVRSYPVRGFDDLRGLPDRTGVVVLDVRRDDEWKAGHLAGACHVPLPEVEERIDEVPAGTVWVHCAAGFRAAIAAGLLDRHGRDVVLINDDVRNARFDTT